MITRKEINVKGHMGYKVMIESYESAHQVANDCMTRKITNERFDNAAEEVEKRKKWCGVDSYPEALDLLENGYAPSVKKMDGKTKITAAGERKRIEFNNEIIGFAPIVPLALRNVPNSMLNMHIRPIKCKVLDVYYDCTANAGTKASDIEEAGLATLGAIMELERQGYKYNLYAVQSYCGSEDADILTVKIKSSNTPLDLQRMSFPLMHPAFFRVIGFDWYSRCPQARYRSGYGHATSYEFEDSLKEAMRQIFGKNSIYISCTEILNDGEDKNEYLKGVLTNGNSEN